MRLTLAVWAVHLRIWGSRPGSYVYSPAAQKALQDLMPNHYRKRDR